MNFTRTALSLLAAGGLAVALALPVSTSEQPCMSTMTTHSKLAPRQEWSWQPTPSIPVSGDRIPLVSTFVYIQQPTAVVPTSSYSYTDIPAATAPPVQNEEIYEAPRDQFGSRAMLALFGVIGALVLVTAVWAVWAQLSGRRPFACFCSCCGFNKGIATDRSGSMNTDIPFAGAGRHFDRRPVSMQPQPIHVAASQYSQPVQHQASRQQMTEPEWARVFKQTK